MKVYVLEIANDSWEVEGVYEDKEDANQAGRRIVESPNNEYDTYNVTTYLLS